MAKVVSRLQLGASSKPNWGNPQAREPQIYPAFPATCASSSARRTRSPPQIPANVLARVFTKQIIQIFGSTHNPYPSIRSIWQVTLPVYISAILTQSALPAEVGMCAMVLLFRYKDAVPHSVAYDDDAVRLFLASYMVAAKVLSDADLESPKLYEAGPVTHVRRRGMDFWYHVSQKRFPVEELCRMELELCRILCWDVQVSRETFVCLRRMVYRECEVRTGVLRRLEEKEMRKERKRQEEADKPPPYSEVVRDVGIVEAPHVTHFLQGDSTLVQSHARALIPSSHNMFHGDIEDRRRFGRIFEESMLPQSLRMAQEAGRKVVAKEKGLLAMVKERIVQIVARRPSLPCT